MSYHDHEEDVELSLEEEASYIQSRAYLLLARDLDQIVEETITEALQGVYEEIRSFLLVRPSKKNDPTINHPFCISPPSHYPNTLLPLALLNGPLHVLDAQEYLLCLCGLIQKHDPRIAVCPVDLTQPTAVNYCTAWMSQVLQHCYVQDNYDITSINSATPRRSGSQKRYMISHKLLEWARRTEKFDSIVLLIQSQSIFAPSLQDLVHLLAELRATHRLPISLVCLGDNIPYESTTQGIRSQLFTLPGIEVIMKPLWKEILLNHHIFSTAVLQNMQNLLEDQHGSFVQAFRLIKQVLAIPNKSKNASIILRPSKRSQEYEKRLLWFYMHPTARRVYMNFDSKQDLLNQLQRDQKINLIRKLGLQAIVQFCGHDDTEIMMEIATCLSHRPSRQTMAKKLVQRLQSTSPQGKIISRLNSARQILLKHDDKSSLSLLGQQLGVCSHGNVLESTLKSLHELLILFHHRLQDNKTIQRGDEIWLLVEESLLELLEDMALSKTMNNSSLLLDTLLPQHRYRVAKALQNIAIDDDTSPSLQNISGVLFRLLRNVISISQRDWFYLFYNPALMWEEKAAAKEEAWLLFSLGIYQLQYVGSIRPKLRCGMVMYERVALVWSPNSERKELAGA